MNHALLHRDISHGDGDVLVDSRQGQTVEVADVDAD
jgi:hypothetical protein